MKTVSLAALFAVAASASFAGSLYQPTEEVEPKDEYVAPVVGSSGIGFPVVIGGVVVAATIAALISKDSVSVSDHPSLEN